MKLVINIQKKHFWILTFLITLIGMGFVIYGLLFGLTTISIFVDGLGPFALVTMVLVTTLSVSYAIPVRRAIEAISASLVLGIDRNIVSSAALAEGIRS